MIEPLRASRRLRHEERGATAVLMVLLLLVFIGSIALAIDGGMLWVKHRQVRNANDAAALAAAISCGTGEGSAAAEGSADQVAAINRPGIERISINYEGSCDEDSGTVHVNYRASQELLFGPAIGVSSPKPVDATATAIWGTPGALSGVVPIMLSSGALNICGIPDGEPPQDCVFWWHKDLVSQATWSVLDLNTWPDERGGDCDPKHQPPISLKDAVNGYPEALSLNPIPTYVCTMSGAHTNVMNYVLDIMQAAVAANLPLPTFMFPVNQTGSQVDEDGVVCDFGSDCQVYQYAIIGFAELQVTYFAKGPAAFDACVAAGVTFPPDEEPKSKGDFFCMKATWLDFSVEGYEPGGGVFFGITAVALTE